MTPLLTAPSPLLATHHPVGASTGYMEARRGSWGELVEEALDVSSFTCELAALAEDELPGLLEYLADEPSLPFRYLSVHAPVKGRRLPEAEFVALLARLSGSVDAIVLHPDTMQDPRAYAPLGSLLVLENMDPRKASGRTVGELRPYFAVLPLAGFCFDIAHAAAVDPSMRLAHDLLDTFAGRLRHLHLSSLDPEHGHVTLTAEDEVRFAPVLARCSDVPWMLEAAPPE